MQKFFISEVTQVIQFHKLNQAVHNKTRNELVNILITEVCCHQSYRQSLFIFLALTEDQWLRIREKECRETIYDVIHE